MLSYNVMPMHLVIYYNVFVFCQTKQYPCILCSVIFSKSGDIIYEQPLLYLPCNALVFVQHAHAFYDKCFIPVYFYNLFTKSNAYIFIHRIYLRFSLFAPVSFYSMQSHYICLYNQIFIHTKSFPYIIYSNHISYTYLNVLKFLRVILLKAKSLYGYKSQINDMLESHWYYWLILSYQVTASLMCVFYNVQFSLSFHSFVDFSGYRCFIFIMSMPTKYIEPQQQVQI